GGILNVAADGSLGASRTQVTLAGGTLQLGAGSFNSNRPYLIGAGGGTIDTNGFSNNVLSGTLSGSGAFQKVGTGTLILAGNDTVSGGTTIAAGSLQIGNGGTTGSLSGNVADNGTLAFNRTDTVSFAGLISGTGRVVQSGTGQTNLTNNNTYSGGTTISAGKLQIGNGATSGSIVGNVSNSGTLIFNRSDDTTYAGVISGTGAVTKLGNGKVTYTGANTYSGGTTISAGTLQVGVGGITGSIAGNVANAGTLIFNRSDNVTYGNVISGAGAVTVAGTGTLTFTGTNTYTGGTTINAGILQIGNNGTSGAITGNVQDNSALVFNRSDNSTFSGVISGTGSVAKQGAGTLIFTGNNLYSAPTTVGGGTLQLGNGGTSGSVAGDINNSGIVAFNRSDDVTYGNVISGTGSVTQSGSNTLTLTATNTYSGGTTIS